MGSKKRPSKSLEELDSEEDAPVGISPETVKEPKKGRTFDEKTEAEGASTPVIPLSLKPMERMKKRKAMDKERHRLDSEYKEQSNDQSKANNASKSSECPPENRASLPSSSSSNLPGFHIDVFRDLSSPDPSVREAAAENLVVELCEVQKAYEKLENKKEDNGAVQLEAEKDDVMGHCSPSLRYAIRRLILGVSSSREIILFTGSSVVISQARSCCGGSKFFSCRNLGSAWIVDNRPAILVGSPCGAGMPYMFSECLFGEKRIRPSVGSSILEQQSSERC